MIPVHPSQMTRVLDELRVSRGTGRMLAERQRRLEGGERHAGWKLAFSAPAAMERFDLTGPVVGFFTDRNLLADGATCAVGGWRQPVVEPEIAVHFGRDIPSRPDREQAAAGIAGLGAAIEIADVTPEVTDLEEILAGDIYQRHVILGAPDPARAGGRAEGITARVTVDGDLVEETDDPTAVCGELVGLVQHAATFLAGFDEGLRAGDVLIAGSVTPLVPVAAGRRVGVDLGPLGRLGVRFADAGDPR